MYDFDSLSKEILSQKPGLTRTALSDLVEEKKKAVGGGYLTDQGALFLVAGDLGLQVQRRVSSDLTLKDLYVGANDITVVARILAIYPTSTYKRKDGEEGRYRRITLFDRNGMRRLTIWDEVDAIEKLGLRVDVPVRVSRAYVRQNPDGKPVLNLGKKGRIDVLKEENLASEIPSLSELVQDVGSISETDLIAIEGKVATDSKVSRFSRKDGSDGTMTHLFLESGVSRKRRRIVIWNGVGLPSVKTGDRVRITNLREKRQSYGDPELHGDVGSKIELLSAQSQKSASYLVISCVDAEESKEIIASDDMKGLWRISLRNGARDNVGNVKEGDVIEIVPSSVSDSLVLCENPGSARQAPEKSVLLPPLKSLFVKVKDVGDLVGPQLLEVIAVSSARVRDVRTKESSGTKKAELSVCDDTGEITVNGWKETASLLEGIVQGERIWLIGVTVQKSKMNTPILQLEHWSRVLRVAGGKD